MSSVNKVILVGRLGKDPELRYTPSGSPVANFSLATDENWKDKNGERQQRTEWHNIVVWDKLAEICGQYLTKGRLIYIEGRLQTREWDDRDGNKRRTTEIVATNMVMLGSKAEGGGTGATRESPRQPVQAPVQAQTSEATPDIGITDDDIPF
ncbi:MAG TPA: single-stranded DNA-binding protein [Acidobacteriota bacterium]|jgi:single-strand DNA-binding protein|nr:single-stranded DNA-binding protein [Acidobacteriota bacterium]